jgi:uncharacterized membrane protein (UPF0127 family)
MIHSSGELVDTQKLAPGEKGITSSKEARYLLITHEEVLQGTTVKLGDKVELPGAATEAKVEDFPVAAIGDVKIHVDISARYAERNRGLMWRMRLSDNEGMLFAYPKPGDRSFWMRNCFIPLSMAYIRPDGTIAQLVDMDCYKDPLNDSGSWPSREPVQYVLEVNQGYFKAKGIKEGDKIVFPPELKNYTPE